MKPVIKPELQAKFLQHLNRKKKDDEGFTLIELLVVVIIIGVLAAIALPSLLGQVNKAKQTEPKNYTGTVNRSQQAYFLEYQNFATSLGQLQVGIKDVTSNYSYYVDSSVGGTAGAGPIAFIGLAVKPALKSYYGQVGTTEGNSATSESLTLAIACESLNPSQAAYKPTTDFSNCGTGYTSLAR